MASAKSKQAARRIRKDRAYRYLVSACLAGIDCTHDASNRLVPEVRTLVQAGLALTVCPEVLGGSSIPRQACEIVNGDGASVLDKKARAVTVADRDVTATLVRGARRTLDLAIRHCIRKAILKSRSPSCGRGRIYDGTFTGSLRKGDGVTAALLRRHGIEVTSKG